jgi:hypothetical protein
VDALRVSKFEVLPEYLVKLHADSEINRPNVEKLIKAKKAFFKSVEGEFKKYSKSDRRRIINAHYYEVVFQALKAKNYKLATKYMLKAGLKPQSVKDLMKRYKER